MKKMERLLKILFFFIFLTVFTNCERDPVPEQQNLSTDPGVLQVIPFKQLPVSIQSEITATAFALKSASYAGKAFGEVVPEKIHQLLKPGGNASYTLALSRTEEGFYYDNLVINEDSKGALTTHIVRYQPEMSWFAQHKTEGLGYETYSGIMTVFGETGEMLSSVTLTDGIPQKETVGETGAKAVTEYDCEVLDVQYVGGCAGEDYCWWNEVIITVDCTETGGGFEDDGMSDGFGDGGVEGGQSGGGGGDPTGGSPGDPVDTVPVDDGMEAEPEVAQITIDDSVTPCVENIIEQLREKDNHISVVPDISVTDSISHISQIVLDLFSASQQYHLNFNVAEIGTNDNLLNGKTKILANTPAQGEITIEITLDNDFVANATTLAIARTIIHESVHAYLSYSYVQYPNANFSTLFNLYCQENDQNESQHILMTEFAEAMGYSLAAWDNHSLPQDYYNSLSWSGAMLETEAFGLLSEQQQQAAVNANIAEGQANAPATANAQGTNCN